MPVSKLQSVVAVTLDAEGTLLHPHPSVGGVYSEVLGRHGIEADPSHLEISFRKAFESESLHRGAEVSDRAEWEFWRRVVRQTLGDAEERGGDFETIFHDLYGEFGSARRWRLVKDGITTINGLKARGYLVGILSNWDSRLRLVLDELKFGALIDACFISCEIGFEKPDLRIFRYVENALGLKPSEILHVGNSLEHDADGARGAGWNYLLVQNSEAVAPHEHHFIAGLGEILELLP